MSTDNINKFNFQGNELDKNTIKVNSCKMCPMISTGRHENGQRVFFCQHPEINEMSHFLLDIETISSLCPLREERISISIAQNSYQPRSNGVTN